MQITNDSVFGPMTFVHSWKTTRKIDGIGEIAIIAQAFPGEEISNVQRVSFQTFMSSPTGFLDQASAALSKYIAKIQQNAPVGILTPESVLFRQDGVWGFLYPSPVGEDDGLSVRFEGNQVIADTDDALL